MPRWARFAVGAVVAILAIAALGGPAQAATTTTALWQMEDPASMIDSAGNPNNGANTAITSVPGKSGNGYHFNGTSSVSTVPDAPELNPGTATLRITASVKFTVVPSPAVVDYDLVRKGLAGTIGGTWKMEIFPPSPGSPLGPAYCQFQDTTGKVASIRGTRNLADGRWHTITCLKTATAIKLIVDGVTQTLAVTLGSISNSQPVTVGAKPGGGDQYLGDMDEVSIKIDDPAPPPPVSNATLWLIRSSPSPGPAEAAFNYGSAYDTALSCDVNGDRRDDIVVYRNGAWSFRFQVNAGPADLFVSYGDSTMRPVCGDWDGDGVDGIGVYDAYGNFWLRNTASPGNPDMLFQFGWGAAVPVIGRFGGSSDGIGIYDPATGQWYLRLTASPGAPDIQFSFGGWAGVVPVVGDWNGDGMDGIGVFSAGAWYLRNTPTPGPTDLRFDYGGNGYLPVVGNWDGNGSDGIGVVRPN